MDIKSFQKGNRRKPTMIKFQRINTILAGLVFISILLFPQFKVVESLPYFQFIDVLIPLIGLVLFLQRKTIVDSKFYLWVIAFGLIIIISNLINYENNHSRDYFEVYKLFKYGIVVVLFSTINFETFFKYLVKPVFLVLVGVNLIHYFNVFNFNEVIKEYYNGGIHIDLFGLDSKGNVGTKRMLGLAGNPNINSIVFLFFLTLFFPLKNSSRSTISWFVVALFMLFLCQSRTGILALAAIVVYVFVSQQSLYKYYTLLGIIAVTFLLSFLLSQNSYLNTIFDKDLLKNNSMMGRYEVWKHLAAMIIEKPIFGYGGYKQYFYERNLHAESQYILVAWRYGIVGLIVFLGMIFQPVILALKNKKTIISLYLILFTICIAVCSITNAPLADRTISVLFGIIIGFFLKQKLTINNE